MKVDAEGFVFGLEKDREFIGQIREFALKNRIHSGFFNAIGAVQNARVAYYMQDSQEYVEEEFGDPLELASCIGNIALKDGDVFVHAHVVLSDEKGCAFGGHLVSAKVFAGEVFLTAFDKPLSRRFDKETGLHLLDA